MAGAALHAWLKVRRELVADDDERALFVGRRGHRLTARAVNPVVRKVASAASVELSAHVHHETRARRQRRGCWSPSWPGILGWRTTRRYSLPSHADRQQAMDALEVQD
jgi:hypothetical protein